MKKESKNTCPIPNGTLLIIGGHENKEGRPENEVEEANNEPLEVLKAFVELIGKKNPTIEVITSASQEGESSFEDYLKVFTQLNCSVIGHIHHDSRSQVLMDTLTERTDAADGVFFTGGDQLKLTSLYGGTEFLVQLKQRYIHEKLVIAGTSAGAMAFSTPMIFAGNKEKQQLTGEIKLALGLEFVKDVCIDTHFVDRGRFVRMAQVIAINPTCIGLGIEEDTAIILRNGTEVEVIGSGILIIIEGFNITSSNITKQGNGDRIAVDNLNVKLLAKGNTYKIPQNNPPHF